MDPNNWISYHNPQVLFKWSKSLAQARICVLRHFYTIPRRLRLAHGCALASLQLCGNGMGLARTRSGEVGGGHSLRVAMLAAGKASTSSYAGAKPLSKSSQEQLLPALICSDLGAISTSGLNLSSFIGAVVALLQGNFPFPETAQQQTHTLHWFQCRQVSWLDPTQIVLWV